MSRNLWGCGGNSAERNWGECRRSGLGAAEFKPRDLGSDRGYRVVLDLGWAGIHLNPHPLKTKGAAPKGPLF
jgi:hypothetical protein